MKTRTVLLGAIASLAVLPLSNAANIDKATWETVKTDFESMKTEWTDASAQFASGQADAAVRKAREVKAKGEVILGKLGMTPAA